MNKKVKKSPKIVLVDAFTYTNYFLQLENFVRALTKTKVKLGEFMARANTADPNFVPKMEKALTLTRAIKKKKGGKSSGKAKGETKIEEEVEGEGSKRKRSKKEKEKKKKIKRKVVAIKLVPPVFTKR